MNDTIMVIDDEQMILDMLRDQFETEQYRVITAKSSEEALRKLIDQPDIILLDINMPGMDGLELCRLIRDHVTCPILFLTARIEEADRVAGLRAGGDDYIMKPFSLAELTARVEAHLRRENRIQQKIVDFIKNADLYMDNYEYVDMDQIKLRAEDEGEKPDEKVLELPETIMDQIRLVSTYKGVHVPSMLFDSTGTKKIAALAGYVIEGLEQGRILVIDELDSSIHFKLTRAIVAMFNNELNVNAQMIFTVHDINLMDCKKMFRKEQIWFVHKDKEGVYVYSLADFTAQQGVRDTTDIMEKYRKGALGALPDPDLINSLLNIKRNEKGGVTDDK